jgi:diguanylate cyclase (GGDEF)-like protein/PAS domain S-box-containing protein
MLHGNKLMKYLNANSSHLIELFHNYPDAIFILDTFGVIIDVNKIFKIFSNVTREDVIGKSFVDFLDQGNIDIGKEKFEQLLTGEINEVEIKLQGKENEYVYLKVTAVPLIIEGETCGIYGIAKDISKQHTLKNELQLKKEDYRSLFQYHPDAIFKIDKCGNFIAANPASEKLSGLRIIDMVGKSFIPLIHNDDVEKTLHYFQEALKGVSQSYSIRIVHKDGHPITVNITNVPMFTDGKVIGIYGIAKDITEKVELEKKNEHMAYHDFLTDLPNRWKLSQYYHQLEKKENTGSTNAIFFIDVDRFKEINDTFGHKAGDEIIKQVANYLKSVIPNHFIARVGGDEFVIIIEETTRETAEEYASLLIKDNSTSFSIDNHELWITFSIGIYLFKPGQISLDEVTKRASIALKYSKHNGKNNYLIYKGDLNKLLKNKFLMETKLRQALHEKKLMIYYQPKVNLTSSKMVGVEALIRWHDEEYGFIPPSEFIPLAEEVELMGEIGAYVLYNACRQAKQWLNKGVKPIVLCVNLSPCQILQERMVEDIENTLKTTGLPSELLSLEITEGIAIKFLEQTIDKLNELKRLGVKIALDDFGTGYSSLNYLKKLPLSILKIDRSFIKDIESNLQDQAITKAIITVAQSLGLTVVAEGIENLKQLEFLKAEGCDEAQGFYFGKAIPSDEMEKLLLNETLKER